MIQTWHDSEVYFEAKQKEQEDTHREWIPDKT